MDAYSREEINNLADEIIDYFKLEIPINNVEEVVETIGGIVEYSSSMFADGQIKRIGNDFIITIPREASPNRAKFTIAHELGHLFLHMGYMVDEKLWEENKDNCYLRKFSGEMEYQAHEFAASLLMPRKQFVDQMEECYLGCGEYDMECVAKYFGVSVDAAINRARWLGILPWR